MVLEEPLGLSFEYSLPNKLFDYIHAGIPIVAGRLPEITSIIKEYNVGVIVKDYTPKEIAFTIQNLLNSPALMNEIKENQKKVAAILCWEKESRKLDKYFI
jgi:glycosyltransferase involved in cell wall biosynthesis